ncbi:MAG: 16S rRNA (cytosine(967)-C(5))-methyltransferase RsmB [Ruminococcus sp.]|nr:16S rRNA (cytosine(967)-C(5))-methyltransferase RsmB [Ruminococcus sp.]
MNTRNIAFKILLSVEKDGAYSALTLNNSIKENKLNHLDSSFVSALVYGVLERKITLDYIIKQYSKIPLKKIDVKTKLILRLGILQLLFMDKVPDSAAVNESVNLAKKNKLYKSSGFINGILRSITRAEVKYKLPDEKKDKLYYLSVKYSCPRDIVRLWIESYGEENAVGILKSLSGRPQLTARVNTLKTNVDSLIDELEKENVKSEKSPLIDNALLLTDTGSIENLKAYREGKLYIQDCASQICIKALSPEPNDIMLDVCSAPGGKSFTSAQYMENSGEIHAFDIYEHKLKLINDTASRLGITNIKTAIRNADTDTSELPLADKVLCDVPCSGLGIILRKPEIRYKDDLFNPDLPKLQYRILCNTARFVKAGGTLVYSTCTLNPAENQKNAEKFLREHPDFEPLALNLNVKRLIDEPEHMLTLFPQANHTDGFFISAFKKSTKEPI